jgi:hypothetical protein
MEDLMTEAARVMDVIQVIPWQDPETGKWWLHVTDIWCYEQFICQPEYLSWNDILFVRSAFNSDTGRCAWRTMESFEIAQIIKTRRK